MLKFFKWVFQIFFLILIAVFFFLLTCINFYIIYVTCKSGELQNEIIPNFKYTLTDINLLFPTNDYHKERRFILWYSKKYAIQLHKLKSVKDGYVVSEDDFTSKDPKNPFSDWNSLHNSKNTRRIFELLIYGDLSDTQKQAVLDFYKTKDIAYYKLAKEVCAVQNPKTMKDFEQVQTEIYKLTRGVGYP